MSTVESESKTLPFPWYGGKYKHLNFILPNLPQTPYYVEPFCGSCVVGMSRPPSDVETYNDKDETLLNFFEVLNEDGESFLNELRGLPYSRSLFEKAVRKRGSDGLSDRERAKYFFVRAAQSYNGIAQEATEGSWARSIKTSRRGRSQRVSAFQSRFDNIEETLDRLRRVRDHVQLESKEATAIVEDFDNSETLFYLDPPYPHGARTATDSYAHEMSDADHEKLADVLSNIDGYAALSSYECPLNEELYGDWHKVYAEEKKLKGEGTDSSRTEVLYCNYDPSRVDEISEKFE